MFKFKNVKRAAALFMALAVCISMLPQVLSATLTGNTISSLETILTENVSWTNETTGKINIQLQDTTSAGTIFTAYKLLDIANVGGTLKVSVPGKAQPFWKSYVEKAEDVTIGDIKAKIAENATDDKKSSSIVNKFVTFIAGADESSKPEQKISNAVSVGEDKTEITTNFGFYIVQQTTAPSNGYIASAPILACLPFEKSTDTWLSQYTIVPKADKITLTKKVKATGDDAFKDETITNIGDTVLYEITAKLPRYGTEIVNSGITYKLEDTLPTGVSGVTNIKVLLKKSDGDFEENTLGLSATETAGKIPLDISGDTYRDKINGQYDEIKITYNAVLNGSAVIEGDGNINTAKLTYSTYPGTDNDKYITADAKVYTLGLNISKVDNEDNSLYLAGAKFKVYTAATDGELIKFIETTGADGIKRYRVATQAEIDDPLVAKTDDDKIEVTASGANKGKLMIDGLNDTTYYFEETDVPTGYKTPPGRFPITVHAQTATRQSELITNTTGINLPVTGGIGTIIFTAIGVLLMAGAGYFLFGTKKRSK